MHNQTKATSVSGTFISLGHLASIFSLLFVLMLILLTLFLLFSKQKDNTDFDEHDLPYEISTSASERKSFSFRRSKQYSSTINKHQCPSTSSFQMDIDEQNTRSTINLLTSK